MCKEIDVKLDIFSSLFPKRKGIDLRQRFLKIRNLVPNELKDPEITPHSANY
jgi:hypothetical protein